MEQDTTPKLKFLQQAYQEGFLISPNESFENFQKRIFFIKKNLDDPENFLTKLKVQFDTVKKLTPSFLTFTSKKKLPFWFGAMTLICEYDGIKIPIVELPKKLRSPFLTKEEIIDHEAIHILRSSFNEPRFEEIIAYHTSSSPFRRYFGPIFKTPFESYLFAFLLLSLFITPLFLLLYSSFLLARLFLNQRIFKKALKNLARHYKNSEKIITLLSDKEIVHISKGHFHLINKEELRWQLIYKISFK